jgi:hypothetical protein
MPTDWFSDLGNRWAFLESVVEKGFSQNLMTQIKYEASNTSP